MLLVLKLGIVSAYYLVPKVLRGSHCLLHGGFLLLPRPLTHPLHLYKPGLSLNVRRLAFQSVYMCYYGN